MKRTAHVLIWVCVFMAGMTAVTVAQEQEPKIAEISFKDAKDYELFQKWVADMPNVRGAMIAENKAWNEALEQWVKECVQTPAKIETSGPWQILTIDCGSLARDDARLSLELIRGQYLKYLGSLHIDEVEGRERVLEEQHRAAEAELQRLPLMAAEKLGGGNTETALRQLQETEGKLLDLSLEVAEVRARLDAVVKRLAEEKPAFSTGLLEIVSARREQLKREIDSLSLTTTQLAEQLKSASPEEREAKQAEMDKVAARSRDLQARMEDLGRGQARMEDLGRGDLPPGLETPNPLYTKLKEMLIDSETSLAGITARYGTLEDHAAELRAKLPELVEFDRRRQDCQQKISETNDALQELLQTEAGWLQRPGRGIKPDYSELPGAPILMPLP